MADHKEMLFLNELSIEIADDNVRKGFTSSNSYRSITTNIMLIVTELSEAVEQLRTGEKLSKRDEFEEYVSSHQSAEGYMKGFEMYIKDSFEDEIADSFIRLFDLAGKLSIDIAFHIHRKLEYNKLRPNKHNKRF